MEWGALEGHLCSSGVYGRESDPPGASADLYSPLCAGPQPTSSCLAGRLSEGHPLHIHTHSKSLARAFLFRPPLLLCPVGITLWPVRQNPMPGKAGVEGTGSVLQARGPSLSSVSRSIGARQPLRAHPLETFWLARFYFSPLTKLLSNNLHMVVETLENAFLSLVAPPLRLCRHPAFFAGAHSDAPMWLCNMYTCPLSWSSNQCSHSGQLEVSLAYCPRLAGSRLPSPRRHVLL